MQANQNPRYWVCVIGPVENDRLPADADLSPRRAAVHAVIDMSGVDPSCSSGWYNEDEYRKLVPAETPAAKGTFEAGFLAGYETGSDAANSLAKGEPAKRGHFPKAQARAWSEWQDEQPTDL